MSAVALDLLGVPSSVAAHGPGQEKAPRALREAGLVSRLSDGGVAVDDHGDLTLRRWTAAAAPGAINNRDAVLALVSDVRTRVCDLWRPGRPLVVLGGECVITVGVVAALIDRGLEPTLVYVDGGVDLRTPADNPTGIADSMGAAHMLDLPGSDEAFAAIGPRRPLLQAEQLVFFGYEPHPPEVPTLVALASQRIPASAVRADPEGAAREALAPHRGGQPLVVHFDVDVIDFFDLPVADVPQHGTGLRAEDAARALAVLVDHPDLAAVVIAECNPDHADQTAMVTLAEQLAGAFTD